MAVPGAHILGCAGPVLTREEARFFADAAPWGFILFERNLESRDQIRALVADLRAAVGRDAPVLIDQEGGRVQRLRAPLVREWAPPLDLVARAAAPGRALYLRYRIIAAELLELGIDVNCAPIADIAEDATHPVLRNRCYGTAPEPVTANARAVAEGLMQGGVLPVLKHIPGHGRATLDSHLHLPRVPAAAAELRGRDFRPFAALADLPLGMTAHVVFEAFDPDRPATVSPDIVRLIRQDLGFRGLLMTDDISMQALEGSVAARSAAAIAAGCDLVLHCNGDLAEMQQVATAAGTLTERACRRATAALDARRAPSAIDIAAAEAELQDLLGNGVHV